MIDANVLTTAPSASPETVNVSSIWSSTIDSSSIIDVSWGKVPCPHRNGEITGYVIIYWKTRETRGGRGGRQGIRSRQIHNEMIMMDGHAVTIDGLDPLTEYSVVVAGVNSAGTGQFSEPVTVSTLGMLIQSTLICSFVCMHAYNERRQIYHE